MGLIYVYFYIQIHKVQTQYPVSLSTEKRPRREAEHSTPSNTEAQIEFTPPTFHRGVRGVNLPSSTISLRYSLALLSL